MSYGQKDIERLIGTRIKKIYMNSEFLKFETDKGNIVFTVYGNCCSSSYFYDFHGVEKLLTGNPVISAKEIPLDEPDDEDAKKGDVVTAYGYEIVTQDPTFDEVTSVFSFRNDSNGSYSGLLESADDQIVEPEITADVLEIV